jgi:formylglycine-generating enzyme required for sulfatase activity
MYLLLLFLLLLTQTIEPTAEPTAEPQPGDTRTDPHGVEQVWVPAGCFLMGSTDEQIAALTSDKTLHPVLRRSIESEKPQHKVCLTSGYWIDKTEVTNASFQQFVDDGGYTRQELWSEAGWGWLQRQGTKKLPVECDVETGDDYPRVCVTWYEAEAYANWRGGSLPTSAQWEYAARGPESRIYPWGDEWNPENANVVDSKGLTRVGAYPQGASWVGALDMAGNAMEWVGDWYSPTYYQDSPTDDPTGPERGSIKIERGGWWGSNPAVARTAYRHPEDPPTYQDHHIGFRVVSMP